MRHHRPPPLALTLLAAGAAVFVASRVVRSRFSFAGKAVVITGGSRGLGLALARRLAVEGARLALLARDKAELARATADVEAHGAREVITVPCDVRDDEQVRGAVGLAAMQFGRIDVLINNAGTITVGPLHTMAREDWEHTMALHFWAPLYAIEAALPHLRASGEGRIVNISSFGGKVAVPHLAPYCASKFALVGLSDALRAELAEDGVRVTTVCPGLLRTGSHLNAFFKGAHEAEFTWFASGMGTPGSAMNAERAARKIVSACRRGDGSLVLTAKAQMAVVAQALMPNMLARLTAVMNRLLPHSEGGAERKTGWQSRAMTAPPFVARADRATQEFNGLRGHQPLAE